MEGDRNFNYLADAYFEFEAVESNHSGYKAAFDNSSIAEVNDTSSGERRAETDQDNAISKLVDLKEQIDTSAQSTDNKLAAGKAVIRHSRSSAYQAIVDSLGEMGNPQDYTRRSCKDRCGFSDECSCKPICRMLKTCCIDFEEECGRASDFLSRSNYDERPKSVDTECLERLLVISSCAAGNNLQEENASGRFVNQDKRPARIYENMRKPEMPINDTSKLNLVDILRHILTISQDPSGELSLGAPEKWLISLPLLDISTGISYKNISIYICNGASLSHVTPWETYMPILDMEALLWSNNNDVQDILTKVNYAKAYIPYIPRSFADKYLKGNIEQCYADAVASCPDNFKDEDINEGCENVNFFVKSSQLLKDSIIDVTYKNPFCLYCNLANATNSLGLSVRSMGYTDISKADSDGLQFIFNPRISTSDFLIDSKIRGEAGVPTWKYLSCNFALFARSKIQETDRNEGAMAGRNVISISSECVIQRCRFEYPSPILDKCGQNWYLMLLLPPAKYQLSDGYLFSILESWKFALLNNFSYVDVWFEGDGSSSRTVVRQLDPVEEVGDFQYRYALHLHLKSGIASNYGTGDSSFTMKQKDLLIGVMDTVGFPFKARNRYFCSLNKFGINYDDKYHLCLKQEYIMYVPSSKATRSSINLQLCLFGFILLSSTVHSSHSLDTRQHHWVRLMVAAMLLTF